MRLVVWIVNGRDVDWKPMSLVIKEKLDILAKGEHDTSRSTTIDQVESTQNKHDSFLL